MPEFRTTSFGFPFSLQIPVSLDCSLFTWTASRRGNGRKKIPECGWQARRRRLVDVSDSEYGGNIAR